MELMRVSPEKPSRNVPRTPTTKWTAVTSSASPRQEELLQPQRQMADQAGEPADDDGGVA